jgi:hypothetical protein
VCGGSEVGIRAEVGELIYCRREGTWRKACTVSGEWRPLLQQWPSHGLAAGE